MRGDGERNLRRAVQPEHQSRDAGSGTEVTGVTLNTGPVGTPLPVPEAPLRFGTVNGLVADAEVREVDSRCRQVGEEEKFKVSWKTCGASFGENAAAASA